jgi:hypothetical protein
MEELYAAINEDRLKKPKRIKAKQYNMGEIIAHGVRYFGKVPNKGGSTIVKAICPTCDELWEVSLYNVQSGNSTSCCGHRVGKKS